MHRAPPGSAGSIFIVHVNPRAAPTDDRREIAAVERYLVSGAPTPDLASLRRHQLVAYAAANAAAGAAPAGGREALQHASAAHLVRKNTLLPLVRAWREAGIEVMAIKGFHLAEFVHASPAERSAHDVDLVVPEARTAEAIGIAERAGWTAYERREDAVTNPHGHTSATLWRAGVVVEIHRFVAHASTRRADTQRRLTAATWAAARSAAFGDVDLRVPDPRDAVIVGIALNRAWSDDVWHLTARDFLDMRAIAVRSGIGRDDVLRRAEELGCRTTVALVLERCDPWRSRLDLTPPTWARRQAWDLRVLSERGPLALERALVASRGWSEAASPLLLHAFRVERYLRRGGDVAALLDRAPASDGAQASVGAPADERARQRAIQASVWAARIVRPFGDRSRLRSILLFEAWRGLGLPATLFLAGERPDAPAWLRLDDRPPPVGHVGRVHDLPTREIRTPGSPAATPAPPARAASVRPAAAVHGAVR